MNAPTAARIQAFGRLGLGAALVAAPGLVARAWVGRDGGRPGAKAVAIGFGARDIGLALGMLNALSDGQGAAPWIRAAMIADAGDLVATLRERDSLPTLAVPAVAAMAGGSVALCAWLQRELD